MPCFNGAAWIEECVASLLAQTRAAAEVTVVDDGSTDDSADIVRQFGGRVRLIRHDRNQGLAVARNTALRQIECDILASVDADVRADSDWLELLLSGFDSPRVGAVGGKLIEAHQERLADRWRAAHMAQHAGEFPLRDSPTLAGATMAVRRDVVRAMGGYDETLRTNYEDADLRVRLVERGFRCAYVPDARASHLRTDTVGTVLRTYWGWLRPPAERRGAFTSAAGLAARRRVVWDRTIAALWSDVADGRPELGYLTLLMGLAFPPADAIYARRFDASLSGIAHAWLEALPSALEDHSLTLSTLVAQDIDALKWWEASSGSVADMCGFGPAEALARVPSAWWSRILAAREALAESEGWRRAGSASNGTAQRADDGTIALIKHGTPTASSYLRITREANGGPLDDVVAAHRIGWLPASPLQQSLLHSGTLIQGEPAALEAVPPWRAHSIDPITALDSLSRAERLCAASQTDEAREAAADALLIARRGYTTRGDDRLAALRELWPVISQMHTLTSGEYVARARRLVQDWLFTWHDEGLSETALARWSLLRERSLVAATEAAL